VAAQHAAFHVPGFTAAMRKVVETDLRQPEMDLARTFVPLQVGGGKPADQNVAATTGGWETVRTVAGDRR
jgi:hypothetical protein